MKLLPRWLGVAIVTVALGGCSHMAVSPVAPSPAVPATSVPAPPLPSASGPQFSIAIGSNGGQAFTDAPWQTSVTVSGRTAPARVTVNCNNGSAQQEYAGFTGTLVIACTFPLEGAYPIVATALSASFSTSDRTDVTVSARPPASSPGPVTLSLSARRASGDGKNYAEWKFAASSSVPLTECNWDFGDKSGATASSCSQGHIYYLKPAPELTTTYAVRVSATRADGKGELTATQDIVVQFLP